jgi:hypothetical protein
MVAATAEAFIIRWAEIVNSMLTEVRVLFVSHRVTTLPTSRWPLSSSPAVFTSAPETDGDRSATNVTDITQSVLVLSVAKLHAM